MEWKFTPEQVVKGEVGYGLESFRYDLAREVRSNMADIPRAGQERAFHLVYDLCHWLATGRDFEAFAAGFSESPFADAFLRSIRDPISPNVEMLGAILQRLIMERIESGLSLERAVSAVAEYHRQSVVHHNPFRPQEPADRLPVAMADGPTINYADAAAGRAADSPPSASGSAMK